MKKSYLMMAAAATMLAACTQTDFVNEVPTEAPKAIAFENGFVNKATRSENSSANYTLKFSDHHNSFAVWGYKSTATEPVFNEKTINVTLDANAGSEIYKYDGLVYWDESADFYQFYAAAPADGGWEFNAPDNADKTNGYFTRTITLDATKINQGKAGHLTSLKPAEGVNQDLLIAAPCKPAIGGTVGLEFIHILSRLNVIVSKKQGLAEEVRTFEVSVRNMKMSGTFDESTPVDDESTPVDELEEGSYARWTNQGTLGNYVATRDTGVVVKEGEERHVIQTLVVPQGVAYEVINMKGTGLTDSSAPYLCVEYGIENGTMEVGGKTVKTFEKFKKYYNLAQIFGVTGVSGDTELDFNEGWENTLTLTIGPKSIDFKAAVATWALDVDKENTLHNTPNP